MASDGLPIHERRSTTGSITERPKDVLLSLFFSCSVRMPSQRSYSDSQYTYEFIDHRQHLDFYKNPPDYANVFINKFPKPLQL